MALIKVDWMMSVEGLSNGCAYAEGRVQSGDVSLFYRRFGVPGRTPILIMHGVNYFDSFDWIEVASKLAVDREVVAFDHRGFGESGWSASKNYSIDEKMADIARMIAVLGWSRPILLGHSGSGRLAISFAAAFPDLLSALIVVDSGFEHAELKPTGTGHPPTVFASVEAAMAHHARLENPPRIARDRARAEQALIRVDGGWQLKRDPDYGNVVPTDGRRDVRPVRELDVWEQMEGVRCPTLIVRGLRSSRWTSQIVDNVKRRFPQVTWATADCRHDIAYEAPDELVAGVREFISKR